MIFRFCNDHALVSASPQSFDTNINIGEDKSTQSTCKNLSLLKKGTNPEPVVFHKKERKEDFSLFWESVARNRKDLRKIVVIKFDECPQLHDSIFSQTGNSVYFLGLEHVQKIWKSF